MPETSALAIFLVASLALLVVPGPAVAYLVARSLDQGRAAGIVSALGLAAGSVVMVLTAAFGVSAVLASSPRAFDVVRYAGAAYLVFLGVRTLRAGHRRADAPDRAEPTPLRRVFVEGMLVNLLNPKTALFFFAFLPQFVNPEGRVRLQIAGLGLTFTLLGVATDSIYALLAGTVGSKLRHHPGFSQASWVVTGLVYIGLGVLAALLHPTKQ